MNFTSYESGFGTAGNNFGGPNGPNQPISGIGKSQRAPNNDFNNSGLNSTSAAQSNNVSRN